MKITIGHSDYTRYEMSNLGYKGFGDSNRQFLAAIVSYEQSGYVVKFETSFFRIIFGLAKYKVTATKP